MTLETVEKPWTKTTFFCRLLTRYADFLTDVIVAVAHLRFRDVKHRDQVTLLRLQHHHVSRERPLGPENRKKSGSFSLMWFLLYMWMCLWCQVFVRELISNILPSRLMDFSSADGLGKNTAHTGSGWLTSPGFQVLWLWGNRCCLRRHTGRQFRLVAKAEP